MSSLKKTTYMQMSSPGSFFSETSAKPVKSRDVVLADIPEHVFAVTFYDVYTATIDGIELTSKALNHSPIHYIGGQVKDLEECKLEFGENSMLVRNMEGNRWDYVIQCRTGNVQPFENADILIPLEA